LSLAAIYFPPVVGGIKGGRPHTVSFISFYRINGIYCPGVYPLFAMAYYNRGRLRLEKGDTHRAIADFKKALKIDPGFGRAYRILCRLLASESKLQIDGEVGVLTFEKKRSKNPEAD
jgi:tetratricopeptide (TPR) repeat protein